jgi:hypothetical protein
MYLTVTGGRMHKVSRSLLFASILALGGLAACGDDVTVAPPPAGTVTVTIAPNPATVAVGENVNLAASITGATGQTVTGWTSSDTDVATVSATGVVTGVSVGSAAITATTSGGATGVTTVNVVSESTNENATVSIASITQGGLQFPVQLNNVMGQIDVTLNVDPGQQNVERVELIVTDSITGQQTVVASQTITASGSVVAGVEGLALAMAKANAQASALIAANVPQQITLSFNTAAFNPETGAVSFLNGRKLISARLILDEGESEDEVASNSIAVTFNNQDGFYVVQRPLNSIADRPQPNSAIDANGLVWYQAGNGVEARTVPVMYSGRTVASRTIRFNAIGTAKTVAGAGVRVDTIAIGATTGFGRIEITSAVGADGNPITLVSRTAVVEGDVTEIAWGIVNAQPVGTNSNETIGVRLDSIRIDNVAPTVEFSIAESNPDNWVNSAYAFLQAMNLSATDVGVGLAGTFPWGGTFQYSGCGTATFTTATTATGADIPECATDLTNAAYTGRVVVRDRLGNSRTSGSVTFGVDKTAPQIAYLPSTMEDDIARTNGDSVFHPTHETYAGVTSEDAVFGVRYTDERSGFDVDAGDEPQYRRITRLAPSGDMCALGTEPGCGYERVLAAIETDEFDVATEGADPRFRRDTVSITGELDQDTPGYYTYETYVVDRAGNQSAIITKRAAVDVTDPNITGISIPATMAGGSQTVAFIPTGTDDLEVLFADLALRYPDLIDGTSGSGFLRWRRQMFTPYGAPWDNAITTPVGPGAAGAAGQSLIVPNHFISRIELVDNDSTPQQDNAPDITDAIGSRLFDIKVTANWVDTAAVYDAGTDIDGTSEFLTQPIFSTQVGVSGPTYGAREGEISDRTRVTQFYIVGTSTNTVTVRAVGPTVSVNPPFTRIEIARYNPDTDVYDILVGTLALTAINDQGESRFYTWTFTLSTTGMGAGQASITAGQTIRAIGVDPSGNGLASLRWMVGAPGNAILNAGMGGGDEIEN